MKSLALFTLFYFSMISAKTRAQRTLRTRRGNCSNMMDRLGVSDEMRDRILFVIRNHLEMVRYANKFDLEDPEVIDSFAQFVEGEQRLRFLYVHTFCDANATAPDLWNSHKEELHTHFSPTPCQFLKENEPAKIPIP